jgi:signal transduction histidine kinase/ActR/RegA family two-component response regulator
LSISVGGFRITTPPFWLVVTLPLGYFAAGWLSISYFGVDTPIWVSNAFAVTALLRNKRSTWPVLLLLAAIADFAVIELFQGGPRIAPGVAACDVSEILLVALLSSIGGVPRTDNIWSLAKLALACLLVPTMNAAIGAELLIIAYGAPFFVSWKTWYLAEICGLLTVVPLLLSWTERGLRGNRSPRALTETILLAGLVAVIGYIDFTDPLPGLFFAFPFLLLAAFSGRLLGATTATAALTTVAIWITFTGHGPIAAYAGADTVTKVEVLQLYIAMVLLATLPVAAILEQRETLAAQLRETTKTAEAAARAKSEFMAVMSHEIRTPMTAVLGMADLLANDDLSAKKAKEYVEAIQSSGRHLLALINDILDFSRADQKKLDLETIDFDLREVLEQVRSLLTPQAAERGLELRFEHDGQLPHMLRGDPTRIKQVLVNLVGNGIKFTPRGHVTVAIHRRVASHGRDLFRFEVRDTGIGIPETKQGVLFNAFSQMDSSTTRRYGGSGLGLAISKKLVEAMGGEIGVESRPSMGSLFWFDLPLAQGDITAPQAAEQHVLIPSRPRHVLLVEDVELNQVLVADMLRSYGHKVTIAENGEEAITLAARGPFDLVLMDVQMPVMDGVEAARQIRRLPPPASAVPILALSANVMPEDRARYLAAGMNGALTKPIDWPQLFEALAKYGAETQEDKKAAAF